MIYRGTTPTITFTYADITVSDITVADLSLKQKGKTVVSRNIDTATIGTSAITWRLTQEETLSLNERDDVTIHCDWKLASGVRGTSNPLTVDVRNSGKDEVI